MENTLPGLIVGYSVLGIFVHLFIVLIRREFETKKLLKNLIKDKLGEEILLQYNERIVLQGNSIFFAEKFIDKNLEKRIEIVRFSRISWRISISPWLQAKSPNLFDYFKKFV